jgi:hypothetical protein
MEALRQAYSTAKLRSKELHSGVRSAIPLKLHGQHASRLYSVVSALLYATIGVSKADEIERFVRKHAIQVPNSLFDVHEWNAMLNLARECRIDSAQRDKERERLSSRGRSRSRSRGRTENSTLECTEAGFDGHSNVLDDEDYDLDLEEQRIQAHTQRLLEKLNSYPAPTPSPLPLRGTQASTGPEESAEKEELVCLRREFALRGEELKQLKEAAGEKHELLEQAQAEARLLAVELAATKVIASKSDALEQQVEQLRRAITQSQIHLTALTSERDGLLQAAKVNSGAATETALNETQRLELEQQQQQQLLLVTADSQLQALRAELATRDAIEAQAVAEMRASWTRAQTEADAKWQAQVQNLTEQLQNARSQAQAVHQAQDQAWAETQSRLETAQAQETLRSADAEWQSKFQILTMQLENSREQTLTQTLAKSALEQQLEEALARGTEAEARLAAQATALAQRSLLLDEAAAGETALRGQIARLQQALTQADAGTEDQAGNDTSFLLKQRTAEATAAWEAQARAERSALGSERARAEAHTKVQSLTRALVAAEARAVSGLAQAKALCLMAWSRQEI